MKALLPIALLAVVNAAAKLALPNQGIQASEAMASPLCELTKMWKSSGRSLRQLVTVWGRSHDDAHGVFMTLAPYTRSRGDDGQPVVEGAMQHPTQQMAFIETARRKQERWPNNDNQTLPSLVSHLHPGVSCRQA
jgi:hypothetical protein